MVIAHCRTKFLPISEVFIENQIFKSEKIQPIVLTRELENKYLNHDLIHDLIHEGKVFSFAKDMRARVGTCCSTFVHHFFKKMSKREGEYFSNVIRENNVQLLHVHFGTDAWYFMKLKRITKIPMVVSFYGYDAYKFPKMFFGIGKILLRQVFRYADAIIVPSLHMKKHLIRLGCNAIKIKIIPWGARINFQFSIFNYQLRTTKCGVKVNNEIIMKAGGKDNEIPQLRSTFVETTADKSASFGMTDKENKIKFVTIGRMVEKKGQVYLLKAFKQVLDNGINAELTIIGQGTLKNKLVKAIDKFRIYDKVNIIDKLSNQEVIQALMSHNIYVQPSVVGKNGDQEGVPTAIMEAMACSLSVIATNHSGIPEIVENNVSGILVLEKDSEKLAEAMISLANNQELCQKFGINGRKIVNEKYNVTMQNKKLEEVYEREIDRFNSNV